MHGIRHDTAGVQQEPSCGAIRAVLMWPCVKCTDNNDYFLASRQTHRTTVQCSTVVFGGEIASLQRRSSWRVGWTLTAEEKILDRKLVKLRKESAVNMQTVCSNGRLSHAGLFGEGFCNRQARLQQFTKQFAHRAMQMALARSPTRHGKLSAFWHLTWYISEFGEHGLV